MKVLRKQRRDASLRTSKPPKPPPVDVFPAWPFPSSPFYGSVALPFPPRAYARIKTFSWSADVFSLAMKYIVSSIRAESIERAQLVIFIARRSM